MKQGIIKRIIGCAAILALVAGLSACGSSSGDGSQGTVDKGFVTGATVKDGNGKVLVDKTVAGKFPLNGVGPYTTTGGTYTDMSGKTRTCPPLSADSEYKNITPMTTLYKNASAADKVKLENLCKAAGVAPDTIVTETTIPANLVSVKKLNETIGEALTQISDSHATTAVIEDYVKRLSVEIVKSVKLDDAATTTALINAIKTAAQAASVTLTNETNLRDIADRTKEGATVPDPPKSDDIPVKITGTTGGTGGN